MNELIEKLKQLQELSVLAQESGVNGFFERFSEWIKSRETAKTPIDTSIKKSYEEMNNEMAVVANSGLNDSDLYIKKKHIQAKCLKDFGEQFDKGVYSFDWVPASLTILPFSGVEKMEKFKDGTNATLTTEHDYVVISGRGTNRNITVTQMTKDNYLEIGYWDNAVSGFPQNNIVIQDGEQRNFASITSGKNNTVIQGPADDMANMSTKLTFTPDIDKTKKIDIFDDKRRYGINYPGKFTHLENSSNRVDQGAGNDVITIFDQYVNNNSFFGGEGNNTIRYHNLAGKNPSSGEKEGWPHLKLSDFEIKLHEDGESIVIKDKRSDCSNVFKDYGTLKIENGYFQNYSITEELDLKKIVEKLKNKLDISGDSHGNNQGLPKAKKLIQKE